MERTEHSGGVSLHRRASTLLGLLGGAALVLGVLAPGATPAAAWSPSTHIVLAEEAARLAPPDLAGQIDRHGDAYRAGVRDETRRGTPAPARLAAATREEAERAVEAIRSLRPFSEVVRQLGVVAHHVAAAHEPLLAADTDPREPDYREDWLAYVDSAEVRFPLVFYGFSPGLDQPSELEALVERALARGRRVYPLVGREYRRVGFVSGVEAFDDRSTAFGVASTSFSRAASDIARVLRYIWLRAGGADPRSDLVEPGGLVRVPRATLRPR